MMPPALLLACALALAPEQASPAAVGVFTRSAAPFSVSGLFSVTVVRDGYLPMPGVEVAANLTPRLAVTAPTRGSASPAGPTWVRGSICFQGA